jgi:hypothetical protein
MANETGAYLALRRLWTQLPATMRTKMDTNPIGDPALTEIIRLCGLYQGDYAGASGRLTMLLNAGALKARGPHDGWHELTKGDFPEPADPSKWVDRANAEIQRRVSDEQAKRGYEAKASRDAAETLNAPFVNAKRADFAYLLDEHGLSPEKLAATVEVAVERVLQAHGLLQTVNAGNGPQER